MLKSYNIYLKPALSLTQILSKGEDFDRQDDFLSFLNPSPLERGLG
jgi:hypothetical protein